VQQFSPGLTSKGILSGSCSQRRHSKNSDEIFHLAFFECLYMPLDLKNIHHLVDSLFTSFPFIFICLDDLMIFSVLLLARSLFPWPSSRLPPIPFHEHPILSLISKSIFIYFPLKNIVNSHPLSRCSSHCCQKAVANYSEAVTRPHDPFECCVEFVLYCPRRG
jgi:hypothetical protein